MPQNQKQNDIFSVAATAQLLFGMIIWKQNLCSYGTHISKYLNKGAWGNSLHMLRTQKILFRGKKILKKFCYLSGYFIFSKSVICLFPISFYLTRLPIRAKLVAERLERVFPVYVPINKKRFLDVRCLVLFHHYVWVCTWTAFFINCTKDFFFFFFLNFAK